MSEQYMTLTTDKMIEMLVKDLQDYNSIISEVFVGEDDLIVDTDELVDAIYMLHDILNFDIDAFEYERGTSNSCNALRVIVKIPHVNMEGTFIEIFFRHYGTDATKYRMSNMFSMKLHTNHFTVDVLPFNLDCLEQIVEASNTMDNMIEENDILENVIDSLKEEIVVLTEHLEYLEYLEYEEEGARG